MPLSLAIFALFVGCVLFTAALIRAPRAALAFTTALLVVFPFVADTSDWVGWVDGLKRYSILIPAFMCAYVHARPADRFSRFFTRALILALALNVAEMAVGELVYDHVPNAVFLLLVALTTPYRWERSGSAGLLGFRDSLWLAAYAAAIGRIFFFNPAFENISLAAIIILVIALGAAAVTRDSQTFLVWRIYTITFVVLQDSIFPATSEWLYPVWMHPENRAAALNGTLFDHAWLGVTGALVAAVLWRRARDWQRARTPAPSASPASASPGGALTS